MHPPLTGMPLRSIALTGLLVAPGLTAHAEGDVPDTAAVSRFVHRQMRASRIPGAAVVIVEGEREVYADAFSLDGTRITPDSPFLLGSVTKTLTALAIAQLADAGKLGFDDPVHERLPGFALGGPGGGRTITLRHLLTHTSGLRQWSGHDRRAQRDARFGHIAPARPPGEAFEYSSLNYMILGRVIEAVSGSPYGVYVRRHIFEPLDMRNSFVDLESARRHGLVGGHWYLFGWAMAGIETQQPEPLVPAGFLISSARDLGHYLGMLLNDGRFRDRQIVSPEALRAMLTPWDGGPGGAGMAWGVGPTRIGHAGNTPTFSARLAMLPAEGYGIIVLANVNSGPFFSGTGAVMDGVISVARGQRTETVRPDEILLKLGLLILVLAGGGRMLVRLRRWRKQGFPRRFVASRRTVLPIVVELVGAVLVLYAVPRWIGVPFGTILEYFPDLGIAMLLGVLTGFPGAVVRSLALSHEASQATVSG